MTHFHKPTIDSLTTIEAVTWHLKASFNQTPVKSERSLTSYLPWTSELIEQVALFSHYLLHDHQAKQQPELIALGYWCRKANLKNIQQDFNYLEKEQPRKSLGKVFHIAPANVDTVFFYSLILSVLSGNQNIVRISERSSELCRLLITTLHAFLNQLPVLSITYLISIIEYSSTHIEATKKFSQWCDLRVIWGGDSAIDAVSQIEPTTKQLCFPDRFSIAVLHLTENDVKNIPQLATRFIADYLPFNQQACSSPKAIFWLKTPVELQQRFYNELNEQLNEHQQKFGLSEQVERQINLQQLLINNKTAVISKYFDSQIAYIHLTKISSNILNQHTGNGLLLSQHIDDISQLPFNKKLQTVSYFGLTDREITLFEEDGYKRAILMGSALSFNHVWDGVDLLSNLTL